MLSHELFTVYCFEGMPEHEAFEYVRDILEQIGELPRDLNHPADAVSPRLTAVSRMIFPENRFFLARSLIEAHCEFSQRLFRTDYARATLANRYRLAQAKAVGRGEGK